MLISTHPPLIALSSGFAILAAISHYFPPVHRLIHQNRNPEYPRYPFSEHITAHDAARIMQNRISIYLSVQGR